MSIEPTEFSALGKAISVLMKLTSDLAARVREKRDRATVAELQVEVSSMQDQLTRLQKRDTSMQQEIVALKQTIKKMEAWDEESQRYELRAIDNAAFVYALKASRCGSEPAHWLCPECFRKRQKSVLQRRRDPVRGDQVDWNCLSCRSSLQTWSSRSPNSEV